MKNIKKMLFPKFIFCFMCLALVFGANAAKAANIKDYPRVAVMNFGNKAVMSAGLRDQDFSAASEYAIYQLSVSGWFDLIDYEQLSTIAKMHSVNMSGLVDPATAVAMGKFAGAQFMVVGNLTGLTTKENVVGYQHGNRGGLNVNEHVVTANVAMRIVDVETGRIVVAGLGKGSSTSTHNEIVFKKYRKKRTKDERITESSSTGGDYNNTGYDYNMTEAVTDAMDNALTDVAVDVVQDMVTPTEEVPPETYEEGGSDEETTTYSESIMTGNVSRQKEVTIREEDEALDYKITIGTVEVSDIQVRNAISKAVRDAIYGNMGLLTTLNGGKKLKIKTGF